MVSLRLAAAAAAFLVAFAAAPARADDPLMVVRDTIDLSAGPDAPAHMRVETTLRGREAERLLEAYADIGAEGLAAEYAAFYAQFFGEADFDAPVTVSEGADGSVVVVEQVRLPAPYADFPDDGVYAFDFAAYAMRPVAEPVAGADGPLRVAHPFHTRHETIVMLPGAASDWSLPAESLNVSNAAFDFAFEAASGDDGAYLMAYELRTKTSDAPAAEAREVLADQSQMLELAYWGFEMDR